MNALGNLPTSWCNPLPCSSPLPFSEVEERAVVFCDVLLKPESALEEGKRTGVLPGNSLPSGLFGLKSV